MVPALQVLVEELAVGARMHVGGVSKHSQRYGTIGSIPGPIKSMVWMRDL